MICKWCNKEVENNAKFCGYCGSNLQEQVNNQAFSQPKIIDQSSVNQTNLNNTINYSSNIVEEKVNIGFVLLSVFVPIAGLIIFLVMKDKNKKTAKASGLAALISFIASFILSIVSFIIITQAVKIEVNNFENNDKPYVEETENEEEVDNDLNIDTDEQSETTEPESNKQEDTNNNEIVKTWTNYEFIVNDKLMKLPCNYSELSTITGAKMKSSQEKSYLSPGYYVLSNLYKNDKYVMHVELLNSGTEDILYTDALVTRVSQTKFNVSSGGDVISFPGGLKAGQEITKDQIINLFGEPSDISNYTSDGYISDTYKYFSDDIYTTINYYQIKVVNGVIDEIVLDHRNY